MRFQTLVALCLLVACGCASGGPQPATAPAHSARSKPNIIVIVADDLGYADIGAQNLSKDVRTPNIDSIAANGARFTQGYVSCPVCSPTRAGLLTGRYQERFGHEFNPGGNDPNVFGLPLDQVLLPQELKKAGYETAMVGKWHQGTRDGYFPTDRGFDSFFGFLGGAHRYTNLTVDGKNSIFRDKTPVAESEYLTDAFTREATAFAGKKHDKPYFLYLPFNAIHNPQEAPPKYLERFSGESDKKRRYALAMLSAMDDGVGQVLEKIRAAGEEENTLIFFISDNGGPTEGNGSRNDPLRGFKGQVYEGGIRIPFMVQWKGHIKPAVVDHPVIALDMFPTACAVAGATPSAKLDGVNLLPMLTGESPAAPHETLYWRFSPQWAIRDGDWKLLKFGRTPPQLFDLSKDVSEKTDLAAAKPEVVKQLQAKFDAWNAELITPRWGQKAKFQVEAEAPQQPAPRARRAPRNRV